MNMALPLTGVRVLDFSRLLPGGYSTQLLVDLGADVIKIETPKVGDYARIAPDVFGGDGIFQATNRGKRSLALNFRTPEGREVLMRMVVGADALFEMFRPGMMDRWGIGYEAIRLANPRLVYCALSGYGQTGPYRDRSGHDLNYIAISGVLDFNGAQDGPPIPMAAQIADMAGGMMAALAIVSALFGRGGSGEGAYIDLGLMDMAISWAGPMVGALYFANQGNPGRGHGPLSGELPCYNVYRTKDGRYLTLATIEPILWSTFCKVVGRPDLFGRQYDRSAAGEVAAMFGSKDLAAWIEVFEGSEVCVEPVAPFSDMLDHPQVRARGLVIEDAEGNPVGVKAAPWRAETMRTEPPRLGEDSRQVLLDFGFDEREIDRLAEARTIREG
jgi:crotonobetainyl-CoA:carnitine CoA-transferase CaiB-like acyl-CoA transferase